MTVGRRKTAHEGVVGIPSRARASPGEVRRFDDCDPTIVATRHAVSRPRAGRHDGHIMPAPCNLASEAVGTKKGPGTDHVVVEIHDLHAGTATRRWASAAS